MPINKAEYRTSQWKAQCIRVIERDKHCCAHCGRTEDDAILQVHHLRYEKGKKAWEYPDEDLITLCKSCHAEKHGAVMPQSGWEYMGSNDLEDLVGECEWCHTPIRFEHSLYHPKWGYLVAGSHCADKLTLSGEASEYEDKRKKISARLQRFLKSPRWKKKKNGYFIDLDGYNIIIWDNGTSFKIVVEYFLRERFSGEIKKRTINKNKFSYCSLEEAKIAVFRSITDGKVRKHIKQITPDFADYILLEKV